MGFLPILLFVLGVIVLIMAWRVGHSNPTSPELLAALKGIAGVKRDLGYIRTELQETEARLEVQERRLEEESQRKLAIDTAEKRENLQRQLEQANRTAVKFEGFKDDEEIWDKAANLKTRSEDVHEIDRLSLPEKYRWVLELHHQGWSTLEIAGHLAISQDAVNMVLKTYPRARGEV